jgi:hypothetical protein
MEESRVLNIICRALVPWATTLQSYLQDLLSYQDRERRQARNGSRDSAAAFCRLAAATRAVSTLPRCITTQNRSAQEQSIDFLVK